MAETASSPPRKRSSLGRTLSIIVAVLIVLLVAVYFVATSSGFIKSMILPRVGQTVHAQISADDIALSPFSEATIRNLKVQTAGAEPLVTAAEAHVRYDLMSILHGKIVVQEVTLNSPVVNLVTDPDGKSNLDPLLKSEAKESKEKAPKSKEPLQLAVSNVNLKNGTVRMTKKEKDGSSQVTELSKVDVSLDRLQNGQPGKVTLSSALALNSQVNAPVKTNNVIQANVNGSFDFAITQDLLPQSVKGSAKFNVGEAKGSFGDLAGLAGTLQADLTPKEIKDLALRFERNGNALGGLTVSGPFDPAKTEGHLTVKIQSIDRQVLNLAGAKQGLDFGNSKLDASTVVDLTQNGSVIGTVGTINGSQITIRKQNQTTPALDLAVDYQVNVDLAKKTANLQKLNIAGKENQKDLLKASLDAPMTVAWGTATATVPDSVFQLAVTQFNIASWQAMLGTNLPSGRVDLKLSLNSKQNGKQLAAKLSAAIQDLSTQVGTNQIKQAQASFELDGTVEDLKKVTLSRYQFDLSQENRSLVKGSGTGTYDLGSSEANIRLDAEANLPDTLRQFPVANLDASSGAVKTSVTYTQAKDHKTAVGNVALNDFTGQYAPYHLQSFQASLDYNVDVAGNAVQIQKFTGTFRQGNNAGGSLEVNGRYHLTNQSAQVDFKLADLNQNLLLPFLTPSLGEMKLSSIALNGSGSASYDPKGASAVKAQIAVSNCVIQDPRIDLPKTPISAQFEVDGGLQQQVADIKKFILSLQQGTASAGSVDLSGKYDLKAKTAQAAFKISNFDQTALRPVLAASLGQTKLVSVLVNANGSANYNPAADSAIKADLTVTNLVLDDPDHKLSKTPLSAQFQLDSAIQKQVLDLRQLALTLTPTTRAKNQLQVQGKIDLNKTNAGPSQLNIQSESLDLTPYYDIFAGNGKTNTTKAPAPVAAPAPAQTAAKPTEPPPVTLPFQQFTANLKIDRFYLRQVAITNWQGTTAIKNSEVTLKPFQLTLNGAPVSMTGVINVGVPGYTYDVAMSADKVPLLPIISSFSSAAVAMNQGDLILNAQIKGAGVTGGSLKTNLSGQASLSLTNLDLQVVGPKTRQLLDPIAIALRVPELTQTPITWVNAKTDIGQGKINLSQVTVESAAFLANGQGTIQIAEILTNSPLNIPIDLSLRRSIAEKANLLQPNTPANATYAPLPSFAKVTGTVGNPKTELNKLVISGLVLQSAGGISKINEKTGGLLQGLSGLLTGQTPAASTNAPAATSTNAAPAANANTNAVSPLDLLKLFPSKKKK